MRNRLLSALIVILTVGSAAPSSAQPGRPASPTMRPPGTTWGIEGGAGIQGILSHFEAGLLLPRGKPSSFMTVKVRYLSSLTWATYIDRRGNYVSFHPAVIGGAVAFGGSSPMLRDALKVYGASELLLGYSFTPYDSYIYKTGNLIGPNLTFSIVGYFGVEAFTGPRSSVFVEVGGGVKSLFGDKANPYVIASSWLGSGVTLRMGFNFYR